VRSLDTCVHISLRHRTRLFHYVYSISVSLDQLIFRTVVFDNFCLWSFQENEKMLCQRALGTDVMYYEYLYYAEASELFLA